MLMLRLALRNIFRNTRRTLLTVLLIGCGLAALLFTDAFVKGMIETLINLSTQTYLGHGQIHHVQYRQSHDVEHYIQNTDALFKTLDRQKSLKAYSPRTVSGAMISSSQNVSSVSLLGVDGVAESEVSKLKKAMLKGDYLSGQDHEILLGLDLADLLEVALGDRIVITVSAAHGGELSQELFRVSGIFRFNDRQMDQSLAFINLAKSQALLNIKGVHEVVLAFYDLKQADNQNLPLWDLNSKTLEVLNWRTLVPALNNMLEMTDYSTLIVSLIMFAIVVLGVVNSMFMSIYERHQEFGVLLSVGTRPSQVFWQILLEGALIGFISMLLGLMMGTLLSAWFSVQGIDYGGLEYNSVTINDPIYLIIDPLMFMVLAVSILLVTILACVYPAWYAARLQPSFAMSKAR